MSRVTTAHDYFRGLSRHDLPALERRLRALLVIDDTAGVNRHDGYPTRTPGNGATQGTTGRTIVVTDEQGQPDQIPVNSVESAVLARLEGRHDPDPFHTALQDALKHLATACGALHAVKNAVDRADNLRSTEALAEWVPQCWLASHYKLPVDPVAFEVYTRTMFEGYLQPQWDEPRPVCRFVYDFVRQNGRLPSKDEMERRAQGRKVFVRDHRSPK